MIHIFLPYEYMGVSMYCMFRTSENVVHVQNMRMNGVYHTMAINKTTEQIKSCENICGIKVEMPENQINCLFVL